MTEASNKPRIRIAPRTYQVYSREIWVCESYTFDGKLRSGYGITPTSAYWFWAEHCSRLFRAEMEKAMNDESVSR